MPLPSLFPRRCPRFALGCDGAVHSAPSGAMLAFAGITIVSASCALAQSCKREAPRMCWHRHWAETNGGIPEHLDGVGGNTTCLPIVNGDMKVNGYKLQGYGFRALASNFPSPGSIEVFMPNGCGCDVGGFDCVCIYPPVGMKVDCPNLSNPGPRITCP